jgi:3-ketosteroid 9alpha-monooxygenase subunit B
MSNSPLNSNDVKSFRVALDGVEHRVDYRPGAALLDCIIDADLDPAFQCREGHCGTCMVLKIAGEVEMRQNNFLSRHDLERGYILLCQSIPLSDDVRVDCDA